MNRITFNPNVKGGRACIRSMRITVSLILRLLAKGMKREEILDAIHTWNLRTSRQRWLTRPGWSMDK